MSLLPIVMQAAYAGLEPLDQEFVASLETFYGNAGPYMTRPKLDCSCLIAYHCHTCALINLWGHRNSWWGP